MSMLYLRNKPIGAVSGGGSGGGHVIENASGTELAQRDTLKFSGYLQATDDSTNEKSVVSDAPNEVEYAVWQTMTDTQKAGKKWIIKNVPKTGGTPTDNSVSVTADGVKTYATLLNELQALVDYSKITRNTALVTVVSDERTIYRLSQHLESNGRLCFDRTRVFVPSTYKITSYTYILQSNNSHLYYAHYSTNYDFGDADASVPASGATFTIYYNLIASPGVGDIDAGDVSYGSGTVEDALDELTANTTTIGESVGTIPTSGYLEVTAPADGYIKLQSTSTSSVVVLNITGASGGDLVYAVATSQGWGYQAISVRKGQKFYLTATGDNSKVSAMFISY